MAAPKYGRLFTEADVRAMLVEYLDSESDIDDVLAGPTRNSEWTFPADEPLFLLRGQDKSASDGVEGYLHALDRRARAHPELLAEHHYEHSNGVHAALCEIREWQQRNPDRVKVPDS